MNKTAAVFGTIWGVFAMIFSLFLFLVIFAPADMLTTDFGIFGSGVYAYSDGAAFGIEAWAVAAGAFGLAALGLIGAGLVRQRHIIAGLLLLVSNVGMFVVAFWPVMLVINNDPGSIFMFVSYAAPEAALVLLVTLLAALLGFLGSIFSLAAKPRLSKCAVKTAAVPQGAPAPAAVPASAPVAAAPQGAPAAMEEPATEAAATQQAEQPEKPSLVE